MQCQFNLTGQTALQCLCILFNLYWPYCIAVPTCASFTRMVNVELYLELSLKLNSLLYLPYCPAVPNDRSLLARLPWAVPFDAGTDQARSPCSRAWDVGGASWIGSSGYPAVVHPHWPDCYAVPPFVFRLLQGCNQSVVMSFLRD